MKKRRGADWIRHEHARKILGDNFIGSLEVEEEHPFLRYNPKVIKGLLKTLPPQEKLLEIQAEGSRLIVGPPKKMFVAKMIELFPSSFCMKSHSYRKISDQRFSREDNIDSEWLILSKMPVPSSGKKDFQQQLKMLISEEETIPTIAELSWSMILQNSIRKDVASFSVRTSSTDSNLGCACLASINGVLHFFSYDKKGRHPEVGIFKKMNG